MASRTADVAIDYQRMLVETEDYLRRQLGSRAAREAHKRKLRRGIDEALRRIRRAALVCVGLLAALIAYSVLIAPIGLLTWLVAVPTVLLAALITLFWPSRRRRSESGAVTSERLEAAAAEVEEWLIGRAPDLPRGLLPPVDRILGALAELRPALAALPDSTLLEGEARRLICQHLPKLVDSFLALPPSDRSLGSEASVRFADSLDIVGDALDRLAEETAQERSRGFETQHRFVELRYRDHR